MTTKPKPRNPPAAKAAIPDPIFALIEKHQAAYERTESLYNPDDEDNPETREIHGH